jgi:hypothetical protein
LKIFLLLSLLVASLLADATTDEWNLYRINIYSENDILSGTDQDYTNGVKLSIIYDINTPYKIICNLLEDENTKNEYYLSIGTAQHIYTPKRENQLYTSVVENDRPYAGWSYLESSIYKTSPNSMNSLTLQIGIVGDAAKAKEIQNYIHDLIEVEKFYGWKNQLKNELGINLTYTHKKKVFFKDINSLESFISPYYQLQAGNISIKAITGFMSRFGFNIPKDFGHSTIETNIENGINTYGNKNYYNKNIGFSININGAIEVVGRDIFLDGNTFKDSHSVDKKYVVGHMSYGFGLIYKKFKLDFLERRTSKRFDNGINNHRVSSLILSWHF